MKLEAMMGKTIGAALLAGATLAVWMWPKADRETPPPPPMRPVKSMVVKPGGLSGDISFSAKVRAENRRTLAFKQSGIIERIAVDSGPRIKKGDKLAWLDPRDYADKLEIAKANAERNRLTCERTHSAFKSGGVSKEDVSKAEAAMKSTDAAVIVAERALADTVIYAPFDGFVAKKMAEELEMVDMMKGLKPIMIVQDDTNVKIEASVPETFMINIQDIELRNERTNGNVYVTFDAKPDLKFPARFCEVEMTSEENDTQVYKLTFIMPKPDSLMIMPGMSATVVLPGENYTVRKAGKDERFSIAESAIGVDSDGNQFVWRLEPDSEDGVYVVRKRVIKTCGTIGQKLLVESGLANGDLLVSSGVNVLTEGRRVTLLKE